jgi:hypothetical protein
LFLKLLTTTTKKEEEEEEKKLMAKGVCFKMQTQEL